MAASTNFGDYGVSQDLVAIGELDARLAAGLWRLKGGLETQKIRPPLPFLYRRFSFARQHADG